jgi:hypothetical protein
MNYRRPVRGGGEHANVPFPLRQGKLPNDINSRGKCGVADIRNDTHGDLRRERVTIGQGSGYSSRFPSVNLFLYPEIAWTDLDWLWEFASLNQAPPLRPALRPDVFGREFVFVEKTL